MQEDLEVTGISRSGRVRKKSSKLMDFESPDDIETRFRRQTPVKTYTPGFRHEENQEFQPQESAPPRQVDDAGTASGSESDYYENTGENADSMESDSSASDEGSTRTPANSLYMMEKSSKKKLIVKDGRVVGRAKAQRKDKGKTRITAYMMWAKEARNELLRKHPDMDFSAISKRLGEMWSNVNYNERYLWKRKAKRFAMQKEQSNQTANKIISNPKCFTPSKEQMDVFLKFLQEHSDLANGRMKGCQGRVRAHALWNVITDLLNSMDGCVQSVRKWQKVWADKKYLTKKALSGSPSAAQNVDQTVVSIIQNRSADTINDKLSDSSDSDDAEHSNKDEKPIVTALTFERSSSTSSTSSEHSEPKHKPGENRTLAPSKEQMDVFLKFLLKHRDLANGRMSYGQGRERAHSLWKEITAQLNSIDGCVKSVQQWQKVWADKKYLTKKALNGATPQNIDHKIVSIIQKRSAESTTDKLFNSSDSDGEPPNKRVVSARPAPPVQRRSRSSSSSTKPELQRSYAPSKEQMDVFLKFLHEHKDLANGLMRGGQMRERAHALWKEITAQLNSMDGCVKSVQQWQKVWADKKYLTKKALNASPTAAQNVDQKIVSIIRKRSAKRNTNIVKIHCSTDSDNADTARKSEVNPLAIDRSSTSSSSSMKQQGDPAVVNNSRVVVSPEPTHASFEERTLQLEARRNDELAAIRAALTDLCAIMRDAVAEIKNINNRFT